MMMSTIMTTTKCWASNDPYLTSLAWCIHVECADYNIPASKPEYFWETQSTGQSDAGVQTVAAKWTYGHTLAQVAQPPTLHFTATDTDLNTTSIVSPAVYQAQYNVLSDIQLETTVENAHGYGSETARGQRSQLVNNECSIAIFVAGYGTPIWSLGWDTCPLFLAFWKRSSRILSGQALLARISFLISSEFKPELQPEFQADTPIKSKQYPTPPSPTIVLHIIPYPLLHLPKEILSTHFRRPRYVPLRPVTVISALTALTAPRSPMID
jgi:hypothetical protein